MSTAELCERLSVLEGPELEQLMQKVVKDHQERNEGMAAVLGSPEAMADGLRRAADDLGVETGDLTEPVGKTEALRTILLQIAEEPHGARFLDDALKAARPARPDPITVSLVLAGIVVALSSRIEVSYDVIDGKKRLHFQVSKAPSSEALMTKFFALFK